MPSCGCRTSSVKGGILEIFGVTRVPKDVEAQVPSKPRDFDPVKRVFFVHNSFVSEVKNS